MSFRAVLFDLDGTLVDTLEDITRCVNTCLASLDESPKSKEAVRAMVGDGIDLLCQRALTRPTPGRVDQMVRCMKAYYRKQVVETAAPYPGVVKMLQGLRQWGLRLGILSNKPHDLTERVTECLFPKGVFFKVLGHSTGLPRKPDPAGALKMAGIIGLDPQDFLYVGDSPVDIQTGKAAGMTTVGVTWGFRSEEELEVEEPHLLVHHPQEILNWIHPQIG